MPIPLLFPQDPIDAFPAANEALVEPNGLLAAGGDLSVERLLYAYRHGIFPWYSEGEPILWWSPDPRCVLLPDDLRISRSLRKTRRNKPFEIRIDSDFRGVIERCAAARPGSIGTWITEEMIDAYCELHTANHAHSVECWLDDQLVGGLYGVAIGEVFFGESMFSAARDASKLALVELVQLGKYRLVDCQLPSEHLFSLGAQSVTREQFLEMLTVALR